MIDGWNNNPTAKQFQETYRRLISHCGATAGTTGNVLPLDDTFILNAAETSDDSPCVEADCSYMEMHDHPYASKLLGCLLDNIVCYIAGNLS